ncbi:MAG: 3-oxoacyl-[acyl-carrier-protein] reductase [Clostridiales Family XIII bacterium]|jgi:3-oxoacyl-[acyl-carrier protein] reductase|nr:3-oxoacyl-[acyl-carrier-protein] reductase [Clostridiales Family XIII bacterium]
MKETLRGRTAVVTGGTRGIGRAIALEFAERGANLLLTYRGNETAAEECRRLLSAYDVRAEFLPGDAADPAHAEAALARAKEAFGHADILVNNAGVTRDKLLLRMSAADFDEIVRADLSGAFYMTRAFAPLMTKRRAGRIVNIASVVGLRGNPGQVNYAAAKAGLIGMTLAAAKELGSRGVTVNAVAPGYIATDMTEALSEAQKTAMTEAISLRRAGTPADVAKAVAFFASDDASYITGQVLCVDGGIVL